MSLFIFWTAAAAVFYAYVLFPALVVLRGLLADGGTRTRQPVGARKAGNNVRRRDQGSCRPSSPVPTTSAPMVSIIVAAHNEAQVIGNKIESVLALDYPHTCLELVIASDGSDDGTNEVVQQFVVAGQAADHVATQHESPLQPASRARQPAVRLLALPRVGKAAALNAAAATAEGEILVFSDANSIFARHTLRALLEPFSDPQVGGVAGNQVYVRNGDGRRAADGLGERLYWAFDRQLKTYESRAGNTISATGALYALRRSLFQGIPEGVTDDFYNSVGVVAQGKRLVFAPEAVASEAVAASGGAEFRRKVRVMTRGLAAVAARRELLNPSRYGWYAWQLFSHKVMRRLVSVPLLALALSSPRLWRRGWVYKLSTLGQALLYGAAAAGALLERRGQRLPKALALPYYFALVNVAALVAATNLVRGRRIVRW